MGGDGHDVGLQGVDIGEYMVVDALEHVVGSVSLFGLYDISVVDESVAEGFHGADRALYGEMLHDGLEKSFHEIRRDWFRLDVIISAKLTKNSNTRD